VPDRRRGQPVTRPAVLVTGGTRQIGAAISTHLARSGWNVAVHYRQRHDEAEQFAADLREAGARACALPADLADAEALPRLIEGAAQALGPLTALVNCAAIFERDTWETAARDSFESHQRINLLAPLLLSQAFARALPDGARGCIVNLIDQRVWKLTPDFLSYTLSKTGLWTLTRTLAQALAPRIRVNAVGPGPVLKSVHQSEAQFAAQVAATPLQAAAAPEDIARAVAFLLDAPAVTGQMIAVDAGQHLAWQTPDTVGVE